MNKTDSPVILIISGPSGAGKSTLSQALIKQLPNTKIAVSHTTRQARKGEKAGVDYHFINETDFKKLMENGDMLEYAEVYGNFYGTARSEIENALRHGYNIILDIDWQGARRIKTLFPESVSVFILPPAGNEAEKRLKNRQQDTVDTIRKRMAEYNHYISHQDEYDHVVTNDDLSQATSELLRIMNSGGG